MVRKSTLLIGKTVRVASRLRGGGSALPGLVIEKLDQTFLKEALIKLPNGVVVISGTNGKTTTAKVVTELLVSQGLKVFTNSTGSNFKRGVISALVGEMTLSGRLNADIAVLELDEAHAVHFIKEIPPRYCLLLNVMRDQLDRYGEIDTTAKLLRKIALATTGKVILNREDERVVKIASKVDKSKLEFFGLNPKLQVHFPGDNDMYANHTIKKATHPATVILDNFVGQKADFLIDNKKMSVHLKISGIYNIYNVAAAISLVRAVCGVDLDKAGLKRCLETVEPAFGRGETIIINDTELELVLVKNPSGFRLGLKSFSQSDVATMIAINDNYADGRDMSWLWDVDFSPLKSGVQMVSGIRAYDMALRLRYDDILPSKVETDLSKSLDIFLNDNPSTRKRVYCTYTAMLELRKLISKKASVERVL